MHGTHLLFDINRQNSFRVVQWFMANVNLLSNTQSKSNIALFSNLTR
jgi:hypothetical protein